MTEPTFAQPDPSPSPSPKPPRHVPMRARVVIVAASAVLLAAAVLITLAAVPSPLPGPRTLPHDPVPAERIRWSIPANCGISAATLKALSGDASLDSVGGGSCTWNNRDQDGRGDLKVGITAHHAGPGAPGATEQGGSSVAAAITALGTGAVYQGATVTPLTGLGDEAVLSETRSSVRFADVSFRTGNVTVRAEYSTEASPYRHKPLSAGELRAGALRAAADVGRALGAPARPKIAAAPSRAPAVHTPASVCDVVPSDLRDRLLGTEDRQADSGGEHDDPYLSGSLLRGAHTTTCDLQSDGRELEVAITTSTAATAVRDVGREYLRRYLEARAEKPLAGTDERYFHALSGLGDQAFCAYLEEGGGVSDVESPARVVIRSGTALISVVYGSDTDGYEADLEPLTREEAVDGAYAVAVRAARAVHR